MRFKKIGIRLRIRSVILQTLNRHFFEIIGKYENHICELRSEELFEERSLQLYTQLMQLRKESSKKKIQGCTGFEPLTSAIPVQRSTN